MKLQLLHGRNDPDQDMADWGFTGPTLTEVSFVHFAYGSPCVFFESHEAAKRAQEKTGWEWWDDTALGMSLHGDMVATIEPGGAACYYGDWEIQT